MVGSIEADQLRGRLENELADRTIVHHATPAAVVLVDQDAEGDRQRATMGHHDHALAGVAIGDAPQRLGETIADVSG